MTWHYHKDEKPHVLVVENVDKENGEIDWYLEHNEDCKQEMYSDTNDFTQKHEPAYFYTCLVQYVLDYEGLECMGEGWYGADFSKAEPGRYTILGCNQYDDYNKESESWIEIANE